MTHAHLTDEERAVMDRLYRHVSLSFPGADDLAQIRKDAHEACRIVKRLTAAPAETPAQDAPDEVDSALVWLNAAAKYFRERDTKCEDMAHWSNVYNAENCERIARLLKQRRLVTRERLAQIVEHTLHGVEWQAGKRPNIDELEKILKSDETPSIHLLPDGSITAGKPRDAAFKVADAILSADLGFKVVSEEDINDAVRDAVPKYLKSEEYTAISQSILRLFDGSAK